MKFADIKCKVEKMAATVKVLRAVHRDNRKYPVHAKLFWNTFFGLLRSNGKYGVFAAGIFGSGIVAVILMIVRITASIQIIKTMCGIAILILIFWTVPSAFTNCLEQLREARKIAKAGTSDYYRKHPEEYQALLEEQGGYINIQQSTPDPETFMPPPPGSTRHRSS